MPTNHDAGARGVGVALVTGASGYVGGRLVPELVTAGWSVRAMARTVGRLRDAPWIGDVDAVEADVTDPDSLRRAMHGVDVAYYLIHALGSQGFEDADREAAESFVDVAAECGVRRIVYLGGLTPEDEELSPHLRSREEVGEILLAGKVPTTVLQAAVIIGSGSASFEMLRYLTERLPVMVVPKWVDSKVQPIAIRDVLRLLVGAADMPDDVDRAFDIGGPDVLTYREMMHGYAAAAGLPKRRMLKVPILSTRLSSLWINFITPVPGSLARPLVESLRNTVICQEHDIAAYVADPPDGMTSFREAVRLALVRIRDADVTTHWSNASVPGIPSDPMPTDPEWAGGDLYVDERSRLVDASPEDGDRGHRRGVGLVLMGPGVEGARRARPHLGWSGPAPGTPPPVRPAGRRRCRLVAGRGDHRRRAPAPAGRDARARPGLAGPRHRPQRRRRDALSPTRRLRPEGRARPSVLARRPAVPRPRLRRHAAQHREEGRGVGGVRTLTHRLRF